MRIHDPENLYDGDRLVNLMLVGGLVFFLVAAIIQIHP